MCFTMHFADELMCVFVESSLKIPIGGSGLKVGTCPQFKTSQRNALLAEAE